ncbi:centrosomal protein of 68 kDa [Ochotona princeps]|uniref:centrosomal protein of 68 kDa n=1 Tax=Ochotona princeps TaxID=9978 RepID=UPI0027148687|nr:centrosomal protein of 68 kDa [Ochotona princeps]
MALGEEKAEVEASVEEGAQPYQRRSHGLDPPGPVPGEQPRLEAEGGPASPLWGAEGLADPPCSPAGIYQPQAKDIGREPAPLSGQLPPGHLPHSVGNQVEEAVLTACKELPQPLPPPRTAAVCSGHDVDTEDDPSPVHSPQGLGLSQQPHVSGFPLAGATTAQLASCSLSASSTGSSLQGHQKIAEPQTCSLAKVSSLELVVPQTGTSRQRPRPGCQWSPQARNCGADAAGLGRRRLSFQAEYWACVLPNSLPPSPDRHSPLWNPNKEYEELLDYTYPLRPGPQPPQVRYSSAPADPILQDSGVDLDSFSVSPASTLKSPTNVSPNCPPLEATAVPFSMTTESHLKQWPSGVPQKQDSTDLAPWHRLASTPRAPGTRDASWESRESTPGDKHLKVGSPQQRTWDRRWPSSRPERTKRASQSVHCPVSTVSGWHSEEEVDSDDEYLALPTRLTQVSSLLSYLSSIPSWMPPPGGAAEGQSSLEVSDSDGPASLPSSCSRGQLPSEATLHTSGDLESQNHCFLPSFICAQDSAGEGSLLSSQAPGTASGLPKAQACLPAMLDTWSSSALAAEGQLPGEEQGQESLVQCVKIFCTQLEELIRWLYNVADATDPGTPPGSSLTALKSSLQLYRQFKREIDEHQSLTESVLQRGEMLLQCLLDNAPVLKDVLGRIAKQSAELESHADRLYDSILTSLDLLAGCALTPESKPARAKERKCERV